MIYRDMYAVKVSMPTSDEAGYLLDGKEVKAYGRTK